MPATRSSPASDCRRRRRTTPSGRCRRRSRCSTSSTSCASSCPGVARALTMHVGVNSGHAVGRFSGTSAHVAYTVLGDAVNVAQRLEAAAPTGQIYVGELTVKLGGSGFALQMWARSRSRGRPSRSRSGVWSGDVTTPCASGVTCRAPRSGGPSSSPSCRRRRRGRRAGARGRCGHGQVDDRHGGRPAHGRPHPLGVRRLPPLRGRRLHTMGSDRRRAHDRRTPARLALRRGGGGGGGRGCHAGGAAARPAPPCD